MHMPQREGYGMAITVVLILIVVGSVLFHMFTPWWWTPIASNWRYIDDTITITFWITGAVFAAVVLFIAYCVYRFRHQPGRRAEYEPENQRLEWWLTVITAIGITGMLVPGLFVWSQFIQVPSAAAEIEVVGRQWQWSYRLPGEDGRLGSTNVRLVSVENPLGVNAKDPSGQDDVIIDGSDLHLPVGKPVKVLLRSIDVLHNFYIPQFRAKMDMVPGMVTYYWFTPTITGKYEILCAEHCGTGHSFMRGAVVVDTEEEYASWLKKQTRFANAPAPRRVGLADQTAP